MSNEVMRSRRTSPSNRDVNALSVRSLGLDEALSSIDVLRHTRGSQFTVTGGAVVFRTTGRSVDASPVPMTFEPRPLKCITS